MLRYSFGLFAEANALENAVDAVLKEGYRTADIAKPDEPVLTCSEMGSVIASHI